MFMSSEALKRRIEQVIEGIQVIRESLAASRIELQQNPGMARKIVVENTELLKEGWKLKDELALLEAELKKNTE
jgi:hypothetical protein